MDPLFMPLWLIPYTLGGGNSTVRYRYAVTQDPPGFAYRALLKVPNGLRYAVGQQSTQPSIETMQDACWAHGLHAIRPYYLGQEPDLCSDSCLFALFHHCCEEFGIDAAELIERTYPGREHSPTSAARALQEIKEDAQWQGVSWPRVWTIDAITGLKLSLQAHRRPELWNAWLTAIGSGRSSLEQ